jgi:hypothetical protein
VKQSDEREEESESKGKRIMRTRTKAIKREGNATQVQ